MSKAAKRDRENRKLTNRNRLYVRAHFVPLRDADAAAMFEARRFVREEARNSVLAGCRRQTRARRIVDRQHRLSAKGNQ